MINEKDVTIIIPHLGANDDQKRAINECTKSLLETVPDMKKIIAVNGLKFQKDFDLWAYTENTSILTFEEQGQCKAVNAAIATTNTPWVFITNDDMVYAPGWWERLTAAIDKNGFLMKFPVGNVSKTFCMSPMLIEPRKGAPTFREYFCGGAGGDFDKQKWEKFAADWTVPEDLRTGFNFPVLIKRELWDTIGGYDINYDPWGSNGDSDLQYKIILAGIQPVQNENCIVYHFSQTSGTFEPKNDSFRMRNYAYFKEKWGFMRTDERIWESDFKMPTKEEGRIFRPEWEGKYR